MLNRNKIDLSIFRSFLRSIINRDNSIYKKNIEFFKGKYGIEIGGSSHIFTSEGSLPVYKVAKKMDNLDFSPSTFWSSGIKENNIYCPEMRMDNGESIFVDSDSLSKLNSEIYDFLLASHVIEHLANPIKTLSEWKRLVKPGGVLLIVAPCKRFSYDRDRKTTSIEHLVDDYLDEITEDDMTHYVEIIQKHKVQLDTTVENITELVERTKKNPENRIMHHHVFDLKLLKETGRKCGLYPVAYNYIYPRHVVCLFQR